MLLCHHCTSVVLVLICLHVRCTELLPGHHRDEDHWHTAPVRQSPSPPGPEDTETATSRHLRSARGNGLDLRPATAAGVTESQGMNSPYQDASATRQTDLGSLSAQLFAPRPQVQGHALLLLLACWVCLAWLHASLLCIPPCCGLF